MNNKNKFGNETFKLFIYIFVLLIILPFTLSLEIYDLQHNVIQDKANIEWKTTKPADSRVYYSLDYSFSNEEFFPAYSIQRVIVLNDLEIGQNYNYYVESCYEEEDEIFCAQSPVISFFSDPDDNGNDNGAGENEPDNGNDDEESYPDTFFLNVLHLDRDLPRYYNKLLIDLTVETSKEAYVRIFVNGANVRNHHYFGINTRTFNDIDLIQGNNQIQIVSQLDGEEIVKEFTIEVDTTDPVINFNPDFNSLFPAIIDSPSINVMGSTNKFVKLDIKYALQGDELTVKDTAEFDQGNFQYSLNINGEDGLYNIKFIFEDIFGNKKTFSTQTYLDTEEQDLSVTRPPLRSSNRFTSYVQTYRIEGKAKPYSEIVVFVNDRDSSIGSWRSEVFSLIRAGFEITTGSGKHYYTVADESGDFTIDIRLSQSIMVEETDTVWYVPSGDGGIDTTTRQFVGAFSYENNIRVVAFDRLNNTDEAEFQVILTSCDHGGGSWRLEPGNLYPSALNPVYIQHGYETLSFNYQLEWLGLGERGQILRTPHVTIDENFLSTVRPDHAVDSQMELMENLLRQAQITNQFNPDTYSGTVRIRLRPVNLDQLDLDDLINMLYAIIKFEIEYRYENPHYGGDPYYGGNILIPGRQVICTNIAVPIDYTINPFKISSLLNGTIKSLKVASDALDPIINVTSFLRKSNFYLSGATTFVYYSARFRSRFNACLPFITNSFLPRDPESGDLILKDQCNVFDENRKESCESCWDSIIWFNRAARLNRQVSDRLLCPSVPSVHEYNKRIEASRPDYFFLKLPEETNKYQSDENLYVGDNYMISRTNRCYNISKHFYDDSKEDEVELCRLQYEFEWDSACIFVRNLFNKSFVIEDTSGSLLERATDFMDKYCIKQNTVQYDFIMVPNQQNCINACHPSFTDRLNNRDQHGYYECRTKSSITNISFSMFPGSVGSPCFYLLNPPDRRPGIYYGKISPNVICERDPNTGDCIRHERNDAIVVNLNSLRGNIEVDTTGPFDGSLTDYARNISNNDPDKFREVMIRFGLEEYIFAHQDKYVYEPSRTFASSITCGCVSSIEHYLRMSKELVDFGILCLSEVQIDPDSTATSCQKWFAMRLCDILYEAIKCLGSFYSQEIYFGREREETDDPQAGIGSFLNALSVAGDEVSRDLRSRYGTSPVFDNLFSNKGVLNAICMGAFFGNMGAEFDNLFAATDSLIVSDPIISAKGTREFRIASPTTGLATFLYHINVMMVSGADMSYNVLLRCSDAMCGTEPCDCLGREGGNMYYQTGISGNVRKYETFMRDQPIEVTDGRFATHRYDTIVVNYEYRNERGETVNGKYEARIREVGQPVPLSCQFDIHRGFRCDINIGERGFASFRGAPTMGFPAVGALPTFKIGDRITPRGIIEKQVPEHIDDAKIFLKYSVSDSSGQVVSGPNHVEVRDIGLNEIENIFQNTNLRVNPNWFRGSSNVLEDNGLRVRITGSLSSEVIITVESRQDDIHGLFFKITVSAPESVTVTDSNGNPFPKNQERDYSHQQGLNLILEEGTYEARLEISGYPRHDGIGRYAQIIINRGIIETREFILRLSLHYATDAGTPENQAIFNDRLEEYPIRFQATSQDDGLCRDMFRITELNPEQCFCGPNRERCADPNNPEKRFCYGICREYQACSAVMNFENTNLLENKETAKSFLVVSGNENCVCDPSTPANSADYSGTNDLMYCYLRKDNGNIVTSLKNEDEFEDDWNANNVYRLVNGRYVNREDEDPDPVTADLVWPVVMNNVQITSCYGLRNMNEEMHYGLDLGVSVGTRVNSIADGIVISVCNTDECDSNSAGKSVRIFHNLSALTSVYYHLNDVTVSKGVSVEKNQEIASSGNTGTSTGAHLHLGIYNGNSINNDHAINPVCKLPFIENLGYTDSSNCNYNHLANNYFGCNS